jgi:hypothetical protein
MKKKEFSDGDFTKWPTGRRNNNKVGQDDGGARHRSLEERDGR